MDRTPTSGAVRRRGEHSAQTKQPRRRATAADSGRAQRRAQTESTTDSLQIFLNQASRYPLLNAAEEVELAKGIERGDMTAKDRMINSNLRLVVSQARRYQGLGLSMGDLVQEGTFGLIRAAEKFDWRKGFKFSTYATLWIRQSIQRGLANTSRPIRLPVHIEQRERKLARVERELATKMATDPTDEQVAAAAEMTVEDVLSLRAARRTVTSLDVSVSDDSESSVGDFIASDQPDPSEEVQTNEMERTVADALSALPVAERDVVELRFGLRDGRQRTIEATSRELGVTRERARQLEEAAMASLGNEPTLAALREAA
jgi:RNA polymerase primary sigma factor